MSTADTTPSSICRVVGLTSAEGKKRNGSAARARNVGGAGASSGASSGAGASCSGQDQGGAPVVRHPVIIDGYPGLISIKAANLEFFSKSSSSAVRDVSVGVGRDTLLDTSFNCVLVENSQRVANSIVTGGAARSRGNLAAMENFVRMCKQRGGTGADGHTLIQLTDLNIARAMNRVVFGEEGVKLAAPFNASFQKIQKNFPKGSSNNNQVLVKFDSHRISEDRFQAKSERQGPQRFQSVLLGSYQIYPCALKQYLDAHEVRYADLSGKRKNIVINHEIYLDYGVEEATAYADNVVALGETYRLFPEALAAVDPQVFWSAVLWLEEFIQKLEQLQVADDLISAWKALEAGKDKSEAYFTKCMGYFGFEKSKLKGVKENWGITRSKDVHLRIATDYAICGLEAVRIALGDCPAPFTDIYLHTLDYYIGTELDRYITGSQKFLEMSRAEETEGPISLERTAKLYDKAMKSVGFSRDSKFRMLDPEKVCDNCGERSKKKLLACARCEGVSYCNSKCQKEHWKTHRSNCSRVFVQLQKQMLKLNVNGPGGPQITPQLYKGGSSLPTQPCMISEVSGTGMLGIFWNPGSISRINILNPNQLGISAGSMESIGLGNATTDANNAITFKNFSELHPTVRFLVCCGPLPQLEIAKQCVSEAIRCCEGKLHELRVANAGFTALEWAAKKGNLDIVKWLCTDARTKDLIHVGCPVGWAGYTGQVEIMRLLVSYGASPERTDAVLFGATPPLMVAAQNGQLEACKFFVEECKINIGMKDSNGKNILEHIKLSPNWRDLAGHVASHKWAKKLLQKKSKK